MISVLFCRVFLCRNTFRFICDDKFFKLNCRTFINKSQTFCSTSEQSSNVTEKDLNNFYLPQSIKHVIQYQELYLKECSRYSSFIMPSYFYSRNCDEVLFKDEFNKPSEVESQTTEMHDITSENLKNLSFEELLKTVDQCLNVLNKQTPLTDHHLLKILNEELKKRYHNFTTDEIFKMLQVIVKKKFGKELSFYWKSFRRLALKIHKLTVEEVVYYFYIFFKHKYIPHKEDKFSFCEKVGQRISELNAKELGIVSLGLSRTDFKISHHELGINIIKRSISLIENFTSNDIISICKFIRSKLFTREATSLLEFQEKLIPYLSNYKQSVLTHIALSGSQIYALNFTLFDEILKLMKQNFKDCDAFTLVSMTKLFVLFNKKDDEFLQMAIEKFLENRDHCSPFLISFVKYLICLGIYEKNLIDRVMSNEYMNSLPNRKLYKLHFWYVYNCLKVDNVYDVTLPSNILKKAKKIYERNCPQNVFMVTLENSYLYVNKFSFWLGKTYDSNFIAWKKPLMQYNYMNIMRIDKNLKIQPIPEEYKKKTDDFILRSLNDDHFWLAIIVCNLRTNGTQGDEINYAVKTKFRHLELIGYKPMKIIYFDWLEHVKNGTEKEYFENQINSIVLKELSKSQTVKIIN